MRLAASVAPIIVLADSTALIARIGDARGKPIRDAILPLGLREQSHGRSRGQEVKERPYACRQVPAAREQRDDGQVAARHLH